ncbi:hypothetical protein A6M27_12485 [Acidithiobacillus thiooxidans]|uniref:lytic transglycosylase domain-containing protein n=1 Tax=Acidithiobacillus thiooxidans TaxID=930 RepID=UPI000467835B|nr:transglycosylase SLT domain-containing protein [Acidithiobacillus thiooxidans]OCX69087.1 hypothetical protein A6O24_18995 [Acidithiobacillus thiooxidans]OCX83507.1 hypothetical protein A6O26_06790 [Acidithiobacillus thiooxidans]OCX86468.1 hypothetical protein A6M27_12485 [Acidithiobacillus thiooxidans]OFC42522.1 hypothetical protein BAE47_15315 [Acidithiobacillus thiooxidans]
MLPLHCLQQTSLEYRIPASSLERIVQTTKALRKRHPGDAGIGIAGIQPGWLAILRQHGFRTHQLATNDCQNLQAAAWILANNQRIRKAYHHVSGVPGYILKDARYASKVTGVPTNVLLAIAWQESDFDPHAVSPKGAQGLMQFIPATWSAYGRGSPFDPKASLIAGGDYLHHLYDDFHNWSLAFAGYNAGGQAVRNYGDQIPPYPQTQAYVPAVLNHYQELQTHLEPVSLDQAQPDPHIIESSPPGQ